MLKTMLCQHTAGTCLQDMFISTDPSSPSLEFRFSFMDLSVNNHCPNDIFQLLPSLWEISHCQQCPARRSLRARPWGQTQDWEGRENKIQANEDSRMSLS